MSNNIEFRVLVTGTEAFSKATGEAAASLEEFSKTAKKLGRDLSQVGSTVAAFGAALSGPLVLAFNNAAKSSSAAAEQVRKFKEVTSDFQKEIASNLVPIFKKMNSALTNLFDAFQNLDGQIRAQIIQGAFLAGVFMTIGGILTLMIGKAVSLAGNLASLASKFLIFVSLHPVILAVGAALAVIVFLMFKFKDVADVVLSTFQVLFLFLQNGFLTVKAALEEFTAVSLRNVSNILSALAKIPGPQQGILQGFADNIMNASVLAHRLAYQDMQAIVDKSNEIGAIFTSGQGTWSLAFDELKTKAQEFINTLTGGEGGASPVQGFVDGFKEGIEQIKIKLFDLKQQGITFANTLQTGLSTAFSDIILGAKTAKEAFAAFGQTILKAIVDFIAQWLAFQIISKIGMLAAKGFAVALGTALAIAYAPAAALAALASFGGNAKPAAAALIGTTALSYALAIPKFAAGSEPLRDDTLGLFNRGEIVIPRSFSDSLRSGELTLSGVDRQSDGGGNIIIDLSGATFNGVTETFVREIFTRASEAINNRTLSPLPA